MSSRLSRRLEADARIRIHYKSKVEALEGSDRLERLTLRDRASGVRQAFRCHALFIMVGAAPNTTWLGDLVAPNDKGFIRTGMDCGQRNSPHAASVPGVHAAGDARVTSIKKVASARTKDGGGHSSRLKTQPFPWWLHASVMARSSDPFG